MNLEDRTIDFAKIEGPVFTGRNRGERLREEMQLDRHDAAGDVMDVRIPENIYAISSSFFLGMFGPSVVKAGSKQRFYEQYHFQSPRFIREALDGYVSRALQARNLFT
ncbi:MAG TPA: hypothetical protein VF453_09600 [Burkholderiaceae bacterium]